MDTAKDICKGGAIADLELLFNQAKATAENDLAEALQNARNARAGNDESVLERRCTRVAELLEALS